MTLAVPKWQPSSIAILALGLGFVSLSGCSLLVGKQKTPLDNLDTRSMRAAGYSFNEYGAQRPLTENGEPCVVLEIIDGKRNFERLPLQPGQSLFIADIIRDADLYKRIGKMKVSILRPNGTGRPPVRMDVDFDSKGRNVMEGMNYSLRSGDHVVIRRDDTSAVGEIFKSMALSR